MSIETTLRGLVEQHVEIPGDDEPLELRSLQVVLLVEAIEDTFGLKVRAADVVPDNFGTFGRLLAFVEGSMTA